MHIGLLLQKRRLERGLTQAQVAEFVDLSLKYVGEIERGEANATLEIIERLSSALEWDPTSVVDSLREPITEGIRQHLLAVIVEIIKLLENMAGWLRALDPSKYPKKPFQPPKPKESWLTRPRPSRRQ